MAKPSGGNSKPGGKGANASKKIISQEFKAKKEEIRRMKSLDMFLLKNHLGITVSGDMKPEIKDIIKALKKKRLKLPWHV
ncbi:hypothetical protein [Microcoleus sp. herbarium14]|uniref:hypothetical protein n=1 Tax=Microcoleus sp. herbarium14 TaxID=3055439 RepID=UPI002FCFA13F